MPTYGSNQGSINGGLITSITFNENTSSVIDGMDDNGASANLRDKELRIGNMKFIEK